MAALIVAITANGPNQFGTWTFIILWWMRLSAKLNVFFGVPNLTEELLPDHLKYLESYFRRRPMNLFFPVSITVSTVLAVWVAHRAASATTLFEGSGNIFLATLMSLAILEHWFLVLPFSSVRLWSWSRRTEEPAPHIQAVAAEPEESTRELGFDVLNAKASV
jgi:putative photosynthetic complex assembly protein 2